MNQARVVQGTVVSVFLVAVPWDAISGMESQAHIPRRHSSMLHGRACELGPQHAGSPFLGKEIPGAVMTVPEHRL